MPNKHIYKYELKQIVNKWINGWLNEHKVSETALKTIPRPPSCAQR